MKNFIPSDCNANRTKRARRKIRSRQYILAASKVFCGKQLITYFYRLVTGYLLIGKRYRFFHLHFIVLKSQKQDFHDWSQANRNILRKSILMNCKFFCPFKTLKVWRYNYDRLPAWLKLLKSTVYQDIYPAIPVLFIHTEEIPHCNHFKIALLVKICQKRRWRQKKKTKTKNKKPKPNKQTNSFFYI